MRATLVLFSIYLIATACNNSTAGTPEYRDVSTSGLPQSAQDKNDTTRNLFLKPSALNNYDHIELDTMELLQAAPGTKSVLFNKDGSKLYAMNLEGMSIYEFDRKTRSITKSIRFEATKSMGWDYETGKPIPSYAEKPVEACLSHDDKILWVSLHNAAGIVPIRIDSVDVNPTDAIEKQDKKIMVSYNGSAKVDSFYIPLIKTGRTPKIVTRTTDSKFLLVSNWHSNNISILETDLLTYPYARTINTVAVPSIPRGIAVDDKNNRSFVAIMGGASIDVINNSVWMKEKTINVASNPRHIIMDTSNHIFISYNKLARIACLDANTGQTLFTAPTAAQPRTIMLSKNQKFLFVTCYKSDTVEVFRIGSRSFQKLISLPCPGHPVGVDIFEDDNRLEAWVCSYNRGAISVFSFNKK